jgi:hypothetical protein
MFMVASQGRAVFLLLGSGSQGRSYSESVASKGATGLESVKADSSYL